MPMDESDTGDGRVKSRLEVALTVTLMHAGGDQHQHHCESQSQSTTVTYLPAISVACEPGM